MSYWRGSGVDSQFYSLNLLCSECSGDFLAEFDAEGSSAEIEWLCRELVKRPFWAFWRSKTCGYSNYQEVEL